ncbi:MAG: TrpR-related protein YerC/YecD [Clostridia bacterium]|nr:TrpR-related protein YerC/YecD [Clostridia bacterium]
MQKNDSAHHAWLCEVRASLNDPDSIRTLLDDLCTVREIEQMCQRIEAAKLLLEGQTYQTIIRETEISSATLSRVSRCVQNGSGGYTDLLASVLKKGD